MTSNEDAETGYKLLKRGAPTPLYYPLVKLSYSTVLKRLTARVCVSG